MFAASEREASFDPRLKTRKLYIIDFDRSRKLQLKPGVQGAIALPETVCRPPPGITHLDPYSWDMYCAGHLLLQFLEVRSFNVSLSCKIVMNTTDCHQQSTSSWCNREIYEMVDRRGTRLRRGLSLPSHCASCQRGPLYDTFGSRCVAVLWLNDACDASHGIRARLPFSGPRAHLAYEITVVYDVDLTSSCYMAYV